MNEINEAQVGGKSMVDLSMRPEARGAGRLKTIAALGAATMLLAGCGHKDVHSSNGNPLKPGAAQKVHLIWKSGTWKVKFNGDPNEQDPKTAMTVLANGVGPTRFEVDIQKSAPATFKDDGLAVWEGDKSNPQPGINSTQILGPIISADRKTLIFYDLNQGGPVNLSYTLSFIEGGIPSVDPIINNGGGPNLQ
jgi:hypothetical protein